MREPISEITCLPGSKIYIFCPAGCATGGPEALHQLGYHLNLQGFNAFMCYYLTPDSKGIVHANYEKYQVPYVTALQVENKREHIIILPETYLSPIFKSKYSLVRKAIWWLSVTNYHITQQNYIDHISRKRFFTIRKAIGSFKIASFKKLKRERILNIGHSYFSMLYLKENGIEPVGQISDYMNNAFFELAGSEAKKEDIIIYNPKKNDEFLGEIIGLTPHLNWKPLEGMTPKQVADWMNRAKLYIDFGYHPGKERMPREACIMRCCMIIGKTGSAAYQADMPIPEKYRFEKVKEEIPNIIERIEDCLANYDQLADDFKSYRQVLHGEKEKFIEDIKKVFIKR